MMMMMIVIAVVHAGVCGRIVTATPKACTTETVTTATAVLGILIKASIA